MLVQPWSHLLVFVNELLLHFALHISQLILLPAGAAVHSRGQSAGCKAPAAHGTAELKTTA